MTEASDLVENTMSVELILSECTWLEFRKIVISQIEAFAKLANKPSIQNTWGEPHLHHSEQLKEWSCCLHDIDRALRNLRRVRWENTDEGRELLERAQRNKKKQEMMREVKG